MTPIVLPGLNRLSAIGEAMSDEPDDTLIEETEEQAGRRMRSEARASIPAVYVDTWGFSSWRGHIRITLGEQLGDTDKYRYAFLMELPEAERFARHILRIVERRRQKDGAISIPDMTGEAAEEK